MRDCLLPTPCTHSGSMCEQVWIRCCGTSRGSLRAIRDCLLPTPHRDCVHKYAKVWTATLSEGGAPSHFMGRQHPCPALPTIWALPSPPAYPPPPAPLHPARVTPIITHALVLPLVCTPPPPPPYAPPPPYVCNPLTLRSLRLRSSISFLPSSAGVRGHLGRKGPLIR